jgi:hydrogenase maturation protease
MKKLLIGGIGNVLLGDDGIGPYIVRLLASNYEFESGVEIVDLGTPALDLLSKLREKDAVILIDSVDNDSTAGTVQLYTQEDIVRQGATARTQTHSPALADALLAAQFLGICPTDVVLVGIKGQSFEAGCTLSAAVLASLDRAIVEILGQLDRLGIDYRCRERSAERPAELGIWWVGLEKTESPSGA